MTVHEALQRLPVDQRSVVLMHHVLDLPLEQVARELDVPIGTVKSRLSRGRSTLKTLLGSEVIDHA